MSHQLHRINRQVQVQVQGQGQGQGHHIIMSKIVRNKYKSPPNGWDDIKDTILELDKKMKTGTFFIILLNDL